MVQILSSVSAAPTGCRCASSNMKSHLPSSGTVHLDGQTIAFTEDDANLVVLARRLGIDLPAPCFDNARKDGCCNVCVVEVDGRQTFACTTIPVDGMTIVMNRDDLSMLRKERLETWAGKVTAE